MKLSKITVQFSLWCGLLIYWNILILLKSLTEDICRAEPHIAAGTLADNDVTVTAGLAICVCHEDEVKKAGEVETNKVRRISEIYLRSQNSNLFH